MPLLNAAPLVPGWFGDARRRALGSGILRQNPVCPGIAQGRVRSCVAAFPILRTGRCTGAFGNVILDFYGKLVFSLKMRPMLWSRAMGCWGKICLKGSLFWRRWKKVAL